MWSDNLVTDKTLQIGAAADRLGLGQSSNVSRTRTERGRASASAEGSSDDEKVLRVEVKTVGGTTTLSEASTPCRLNNRSRLCKKKWKGRVRRKPSKRAVCSVRVPCMVCAVRRNRMRVRTVLTSSLTAVVILRVTVTHLRKIRRDRT